MRIIESKSLDKDLMFIFILRSEIYPTILQCSKGVWMWHLGLQFSVEHGAVFTVGLNDLTGLLQPEGFYV